MEKSGVSSRLAEGQLNAFLFSETGAYARDAEHQLE